MAKSLFAFEFQVLRLCGDARTREELIAVAYPCACVNGHGVHYGVVVSYDNVLVYVAERTNGVAITQHSFGVNVGQGTYIVHSSDRILVANVEWL